jgi:hypothetical protein
MLEPVARAWTGSDRPQRADGASFSLCYGRLGPVGRLIPQKSELNSESYASSRGGFRRA